MSEYEIHEYCDIFPDLDDKAITEMASSIASEGQLDPIIRWGNIILDGKNRLRACKVAGVVPVFESWAPTKPADKQLADDEAWAFCRAKNYNRRHLTTSQLSMIAGKELDRRCANLHTETTVQEIADKHGVSKRSVDSAKKVIANGSSDLQHAVTNGHVTVSDAASIVDQPKPKQNAAVKAVTNGHAKTVNEAIREPGDETENDKKPKPKEPRPTDAISQLAFKLKGQCETIKTTAAELFRAVDAKKDSCPAFAQRHKKYESMLRALGELLDPVQKQVATINTSWDATRKQLGE